MVKHIDLRFAGNTDEELNNILVEFEVWEKTGSVADDAFLRQKANAFGKGSVGMTVCALYTFRELLFRRMKKEETDGKDAR